MEPVAGVGVGVGVGVAVRVRVGVGPVGVRVAVRVFVRVGVRVGPVGVRVGVRVRVRVGVAAAGATGPALLSTAGPESSEPGDVSNTDGSVAAPRPTALARAAVSDAAVLPGSTLTLGGNGPGTASLGVPLIAVASTSDAAKAHTTIAIGRPRSDFVCADGWGVSIAAHLLEQLNAFYCP